MLLAQLFTLHKHSQTAFHNLCTHKQPPVGTSQLLWNGLKFCIEQALPKPNLDNTITRLTNDIRRKYYWRNRANDGNYEPKLYIKSDWQAPDAAPELETAITLFKDRLLQQVQHNLQHNRRRHNLPPKSRLLLRDLPNNKDFIVLPTDKNLGPSILERSTYKTRCLQDHLSDANTYRQLSKEEATDIMYRSFHSFENLIKEFEKTIPEHELTYFHRCFEQPRRIPQFYCTPKVHKKPLWKTRPITSGINSRMADLSKYIDVYLQKVVTLCPCYLKDSHSLLKRLKALGKLPPSAVIVTADATSMYTNIDTAHGLQTLKDWLHLHRHDLPEDYPTELILRATRLVMYNNVFQFDDTYWLQRTGTAMGTNLACVYATIYYSYHEETRILPTFGLTQSQRNPPLLLYGRLIDDAVQIWDTRQFPPDLTLYTFVEKITATMGFGSLQWEVEAPTKEVNFLDLSIRLLEDGTIFTETFVKDMNLHLYIPPESAHPRGVLKSLIFGNLQRYWTQNSSVDCFINTTGAFHGHLLNRGYTTEMLNPLFQEAAQTIDRKTTENKTPPSPLDDSCIFIHWAYHPRDIRRGSIRQTFDETLGPLLAQSGLPVSQLTIAYSVPQSLGQCLTKTQLLETPEDRVSKYVELMEPPPANL